MAPHLSIHHIHLYVSDYDRTLRFLTGQLGLRLLFDAHTANVGRFVAVGTPDGVTMLGIVVPPPESREHSLIGRSGHVVFVTDDVTAKYGEWSARDVVFDGPPQSTEWGGIYTTFSDPDGNRFSLMSQDGLTRKMQAERQAALDRQEAERRALHEMEIAREVQARLFPQRPPESPTLDLAGRCLQARQVGGDYFDYLPLGPTRLGLVLGDISGKGIAAALLMANLQGSLRSQSHLAVEHPSRFLSNVNTHFFQHSPPGAYTTLFMGAYSEDDGRLRYLNCGHPPPLLFRPDGGVEQLPATSTMVGLFANLDASPAETHLDPGDMLVVYSDGVSECADAAGEEFGAGRLIDAVREAAGRDSTAAVDHVFSRLLTFGGPEQQDDITLLIARHK